MAVVILAAYGIVLGQWLATPTTVTTAIVAGGAAVIALVALALTAAKRPESRTQAVIRRLGRREGPPRNAVELPMAPEWTAPVAFLAGSADFPGSSSAPDPEPAPTQEERPIHEVEAAAPAVPMPKSPPPVDDGATGQQPEPADAIPPPARVGPPVRVAPQPVIVRRRRGGLVGRVRKLTPGGSEPGREEGPPRSVGR